MLFPKTAQTETLWQAYCRAGGPVDEDYVVARFGDGPALADELLALVLHGPKRATASLARDYSGGGDPMPKAGDHWMVLDGAGVTRCILRTSEVRIGPLASVDDRFAWDEGEGDRSRDWWLAAHRRYFGRQAAREGFAFSDEIATVFERFDLVWPRG